jgi:Bacteriocin-protection, YdeI or OmpD-Associated/Domain of unknown function (DUF1905)
MATDSRQDAAEVPRVSFRATILRAGKTATGIEVPAELLARLGTSKRPPVRVTVNGHTYRSTVAVMAGKFMIGVSAENRAAAGVDGGDEVDVGLELDTAPREVAVPADLAAALAADPAAKQDFERLSVSRRQAHVVSVEGAKTAETRQRRIARVVGELGAGAAS